MAATNPIDEYLAALDEPKRTTLTSLRDTIMAIFPRRGAVHLIRAARIQAAREDHRRVRGLQEPPQLPATALAQKLLELSPGRFLVDVRQSPGYSLGRPVPAQQARPAHRPKPASGPKNPVRTAGVRCTMAW
jgi:hypothetical protein